MLSHGWKGIMGDRCIFLLYDEEHDNDVIGAAGIHVDDFLLCGNEQHPKYVQAEKALMGKYKWGSGKQMSLILQVVTLCNQRTAASASTRRAMLRSGSMKSP